jgi:hypothetical protein
VRLEEEGRDGEDGDCGHATYEGGCGLAWSLRSGLRQRERGVVDGGRRRRRRRKVRDSKPRRWVDCALRAK